MNYEDLLVAIVVDRVRYDYPGTLEPDPEFEDLLKSFFP